MKEKYSFREFLTKETYIGVEPETNEEIWEVISKVEIPMIQRDYAQGRIKYQDGTQTILNDTGSRFLKSLFNKIKANQDMELEFIYGSVEERPIPKSREKEYAYIPLDGQQRLTTLFLLHWYFGMRELSPNSDERQAHLKLISKFTYLTRTSSRIFCECICDWSKMKEIDVTHNVPSQIISNCPWFFKEYKKDPTVKAILAMIDNIAIQYDETNIEGESYLSRLDKLKFYVFPLNKYKLTEDLYIKMNARGKQLTGYENFKADLINWMKSNKNPESEMFNSMVKYRGRNMKYYMAFAQKMDNEWTDIFWNNIKTDPAILEPQMAGKTVDTIFMRFYIRLFHIAHILNLQQQAEITDEQIADDDVVKYFYGDKGNDSNIQYNNNDFSDKYLTCLSYELLHRIEKFLDSIKDRLELVNNSFVPSWQKDNVQSDSSFYGPDFSWQKRIVFLAIFNYFTKNESFDEVNFKDWLRIVWNFVVDPTIRNVKDNIGTLRFINELSNNCSDIVSWIAENPEGQRLKIQYAEEHIKAKLVVSNPDWRAAIAEGESHSVLKGRILFMLPQKEQTSMETYSQYLEASRWIIPYDKTDFLWIRAILSQIKEYNLDNGSLTLSDIRENWKTSISDNLMIPFHSLIQAVITFKNEGNLLNTDSVRGVMQDLCDNYEQKPGVEWIYPLVKWQHEDRTLLNTYTYSQRIDKRDNHVYLCYKTTLASDSCILLDGYRDKLISEILPLTEGHFEWGYTSYPCSIEDTFFRGMKVTLFRDVRFEGMPTIKACYIFDAEHVFAGIRALDNPAIDFDDDTDTHEWSQLKEYSITGLSNDEDMKSLVENIENEVFNMEDTGSLLSTAQTRMIEKEHQD